MHLVSGLFVALTLLLLNLHYLLASQTSGTQGQGHCQKNKHLYTVFEEFIKNVKTLFSNHVNRLETGSRLSAMLGRTHW